MPGDPQTTIAVPSEPTLEMLYAGYQADDGNYKTFEDFMSLCPGWREDQCTIWRAMLRSERLRPMPNDNQVTKNTCGWGPFRRDWYSICSAHRTPVAGCSLCQTGHWVNCWGHMMGSVVYRAHKPTWLWWVNRRRSKRRRWLESVFPNLKG